MSEPKQSREGMNRGGGERTGNNRVSKPEEIKKTSSDGERLSGVECDEPSCMKMTFIHPKTECLYPSTVRRSSEKNSLV